MSTNRLMFGLLGEDACQAFAKEVRQMLRKSRPDPQEVRRALYATKREADNIMSAIRKGIDGLTVPQGMTIAERKVSEAEAQLRTMESFELSQALPRAREIHRSLVERLEEIDDIAAARDPRRDTPCAGC